MQKRCRGQSSVHNDVPSKPLSEVRDGAPQQALYGGVLAIAGPVRLSIAGQRQSGPHHADHDEMMLITEDLLRGVLLWPTQGAALAGSPSGTGAVDRQTDPAVSSEGFVSLGAANHLRQCLPQAVGIQARRKIAQRVVSEPNRDPQTDSRRRARQGFHGMKAPLS